MKKLLGYLLVLSGGILGLALLLYFFTQFQESWTQANTQFENDTIQWSAAVFFFGLAGGLSAMFIWIGTKLIRKK